MRCAPCNAAVVSQRECFRESSARCVLCPANVINFSSSYVLTVRLLNQKAKFYQNSSNVEAGEVSAAAAAAAAAAAEAAPLEVAQPAGQVDQLEQGVNGRPFADQGTRASEASTFGCALPPHVVKCATIRR